MEVRLGGGGEHEEGGNQETQGVELPEVMPICVVSCCASIAAATSTHDLRPRCPLSSNELFGSPKVQMQTRPCSPQLIS